MKLIRYHTNPRYTPSVSYPTLRHEMDRLFDVAFPSLSEFPVDLYQDKNAYTLRAELPGFRKEDISVETADGVLTVTGHRKAADTILERRVSRAVTLPENLDVEKIQAAYENGVLSVTLPKREEVKPRQIAVDVK